MSAATYDLIESPWQRKLVWASAAAAAHLAAILLALSFLTGVSMEAPQVLSVTMIDSPPAPTPPAPQPKPVIKQQQVKPVVAPRQALTTSQTAISQPQAPSTNTTEAAPSNAAPSGNSQPANETYVEPRHDAAYLNNPYPQRPQTSVRLNEFGIVQLRVYVSPAGLPEKVEVKNGSGFSRLDAAASETVLQKWKFIPARRGDTPVAAWVTFRIDFKASPN